MNCPKCGTQRLSDQVYCRSCGSGLNDAARQLSVELDRSQGRDKEPRLGHFVFYALAIMLFGAAIGVLGKMLLHNEAVTVVGVLISLAGLLLVAYPFLVPRSPKRIAGEPAVGDDGIFRARPTRQLHPSPASDDIPSVTENTTELLKTPIAPRETRNLDK